MNQVQPQSIAGEISRRAVQLLREFTGRGPTKARTVVSDTSVMVLLEDTLTKGERHLAASGKADVVLRARHEFQWVMRDELVRLVEEETGRRVIAFMTDNHIDPDMAAEIFVLEPAGDGDSSAEYRG